MGEEDDSPGQKILCHSRSGMLPNFPAEKRDHMKLRGGRLVKLQHQRGLGSRPEGAHKSIYLHKNMLFVLLI